MGTYSLLNIIWFVTLIKCCGSFLVKKIYIYSTLLFIFQGAAYYSSTYPFHQEYLSTSAFSRPFLEFYLVLFWRFSFIIVFVLEKKKEEKIWKKKRKSKRKRKTRRRRKWGRKKGGEKEEEDKEEAEEEVNEEKEEEDEAKEEEEEGEEEEE